MKKPFVKMMAAVMAFAFFVQAASTVAVDAAGGKRAALNAYARALQQGSIQWDNGTVSLDDSGFGLAYVNNDSIPELAVYVSTTCHAEGYCALYAYKNGKVTLIGTMMDGVAVYPKKNLVEAIHSGTGGYEHYYLTVSGTKVKGYLHKVGEKESGWDMNGDGKISGTYYSRLTSGLWETKAISKKKFDLLLKKKAGTAKLKKIKFYENTKVNRDKVLG